MRSRQAKKRVSLELDQIHIRCHRRCLRSGTQRAAKVDVKRIVNLFENKPGTIILGNEHRAFTLQEDQIIGLQNKQNYDRQSL